jgi:hypothetical protein
MHYGTAFLRLIISFAFFQRVFLRKVNRWIMAPGNMAQSRNGYCLLKTRERFLFSHLCHKIFLRMQVCGLVRKLIKPTELN